MLLDRSNSIMAIAWRGDLVQGGIGKWPRPLLFYPWSRIRPVDAVRVRENGVPLARHRPMSSHLYRTQGRLWQDAPATAPRRIPVAWPSRPRWNSRSGYLWQANATRRGSILRDIDVDATPRGRGRPRYDRQTLDGRHQRPPRNFTRPSPRVVAQYSRDGFARSNRGPAA